MNRFFGCCDDVHIDYSKMAFPSPFGYVHVDCDFAITILIIIIYPVYWILVSQLEYGEKRLQSIFSGSYNACGLFAMTHLPLCVYRGCRFMTTVRRQPLWWFLRQNPVLWTGHTAIVLGIILVITSFYRLGLWTTLLGDYFGITDSQTDIRRQFPYTWFYHPMYWGTTFVFFGISLVMASQAGLILTLLIMLMYRIAIYFEHALFIEHHFGIEVTSTPKREAKRGRSEKVASSLRIKESPLKLQDSQDSTLKLQESQSGRLRKT